MEISKVRFIEPGNRPYRPSPKNLYTYERYIRNPSIGLMTLATIVHESVPDTFMYSESVSKVVWDDVLDANVVFIGIFTFAALRGYEIAERIRRESDAVVVLGGLHASMNYPEAVEHADYVLLGEGDESVLELLASLERDEVPSFPGIVYLRDGEVICAGQRPAPHDIDTVPDRLLLYRYDRMASRNTLWPQVHASRGCPHSCDYCAVVRHFGRKVRTRSVESVLEDIRQAIAFHERGTLPRLARVVWLTDDNFFADRAWAIEVLRAIIASDIDYAFTVQARYEVGFDDEMLDLMKRAGFFEVAMGIEFLEDESFEAYHKRCTHDDIVRAIENIQAHGLNVRGLFIVGADTHTSGVGERLARFVIEHGLRGVLIQAMYLVPGTPAYDAASDRLIDDDWSRTDGKVVMEPLRMSACELQEEIIHASRTIYSRKRLIHAILRESGLDRLLFVGEYFWQKSIRSDLKADLPYLRAREGAKANRT
ncbi:B12-binding domain-containing radical SAM protein [Raoultibacter phocaeensis]|uniref:B12-binding domain-containing radical SAM protein n=1 Tax=Raoultibacter phocaeensis TaxID=2479841 RepID=UPI0015D5AD9B|nr:radical SAM protein [Raoultibacter phocaeensis]